jgi:hypothetical protein
MAKCEGRNGKTWTRASQSIFKLLTSVLQATAGLRCRSKSNTIGPPCLSTVVSPIPRMNRVATILLLSLSALLAGCAKPDVKYSDLSPATTATVSGDTVTIHLGSDLIASACWTIPKARVEGQTVCVVGYRTIREQSREFVVRLPASVSSQSVPVVWIDPDGSRVPVPIKK